MILTQVYYSTPSAIFQHNQETIHTASTVMAANLIAPDSLKNGAIDLWGHVKVPRIDWAEFGTDSKSPWVTLDSSLKSGSNATIYPYNFTSWTGIALQNIRPDRKTYFTMDYDYVDLTCTLQSSTRNPVDILAHWTQSEINVEPFDHHEDWIAKVIAQNDTANAGSILFNRTVKAYGRHVPSPRPASSFFKFAYNGTSPEGKTNQTASHITYFLYGYRYNETSVPQVLQCLPAHIHLELQVQCQSYSQCEITRMRRKPATVTAQLVLEKKILPAPRCDLDYGGLVCLLLNTKTLEFFIDLWATVVSTPTQDNGTDPFVLYITALKNNGYETINAKDLSVRLTLAFNAYWQAILWQGQTVLTDAFDSSQSLSMSNTETREEPNTPIYRISIPWVVVLITATLALLALTTTNIVVSLMIISPDLLGYVSTLTRSSAAKSSIIPYHVETGTTLDGAERDRLLRDKIIRIEDMRPSADVGYIAIRLCEGKERLSFGEPRRLRKGRLYA
ncbi:hypothetical protein BKA66DRAFT_61805 [Pyrenochaeta sp. MPI-SDFR-AT-0127]|nr:hypothetical protein BKA66DRAFT_61805 [Pyrenochaeta sp. MPI-SDFR-AT-0127]